MSESQSFAEELARQEIRDEERVLLQKEHIASLDKGGVQRNLMIALLLYVSVCLVVVSAAAGLAVRVFLWSSGI